MSRTAKMNAGPLHPAPATPASTCRIWRACSSWLTPRACGAQVEAPSSVIQTFLSPSPLTVIRSCTRTRSDHPLSPSSAIPPGNTYGCIAVASKNFRAPLAYMSARNFVGASGPVARLSPAAMTVASG
ncbi:Uncharacterised protein [Mycobacteroides abscessus subsp. abscessus]|nr:Uncharacterised protein [Mycobacteroides abscessus subsp. abscessus]